MNPENKTQNTGIAYPSDANNLASSGISSGPLFDPQALTMMPDQQQVVAGVSSQLEDRPGRTRRMIKRGGLAFAALLLVSGMVWVLASATRTSNNLSSTNPANDFDTTTLPLSELSIDVGIAEAETVAINGSLTLNGSFTIAPSLQPASAQAGQIYYDKNTNQLAYYNGSQFVALGAQGQVVQSVGGVSGQLGVGNGLGIVGNQLVNAGVTSFGGQVGAISIGSGLVMGGNVLQNNGVLNVIAGSNISVTNDGNGNYTVNNIGAGTGTVTSGGGTAGRIPLFTSAQNIEDSIVSQSGLTVTITGDLSVVTGGLSLSNALTVSNGGTGATSLAANGVIVGNGTSAFSSVAAGGAGLCLLSTAGAPTWGACPGGVGVSSLNGLTGALNIANASGAGNTITIDDATTVSKGIASFNSTNFSVSSGAVNTIQNINTAASPTFAGVNTNNITPGATLTVGAAAETLILQGDSGTVITATSGVNTTTVGFTPPTADVNLNFPALAAGVYDFCTTSGNCLGGSGGGANTSLSNLTGVAINTTLLPGSAGSVNLGSAILPFGDIFLAGTSGTPATNNFRITGASTGGTRTITLPNASGTVCIDTGNCAGSGGGVTTAGGTIGTLPVFTAGQVIGDSLVSQSGGTVTANGHLSLSAGNQFQINGTQISSANLSNDANLAKLGASQTFTGATNAFQNGANSTNAFNVQNAAGTRVLTVDTTNGEVELGIGSTLDGKLVFSNVSNANTVTIVPGTPSAPRTITLPNDSGIICLDSGNCAGAGATLQTAYNFSVGGTTPKIKVDATRLGVDIQDADTTIGANLFNVRASNNLGLGQVLFGVGSTGDTTVQTATNSTSALRLLTNGGTTVFVGDTQNGQIVLGQSSTLNGTIVFNNSSNSNQITLSTAAASGPQSITLPNASGTVCLTSGNCAGVGGTGDILQNGNSFTAAMTIGTNDAFDLNLERQNVTKVTVGANNVTLAADVDLLLQGMGSYISNPRNGLRSEAFGLNATTNNAADDALSVGYNALSATGAVALGSSASADTSASIAIGNGANANGDSGAIAIGYNSSTSGNSSIALGIDAATTAANQMVIGAGNSNHINRVVIGNGVTHGTPIGFTLQGTSGFGTDIGGASVAIAGGQGTGTGNGGGLNFQIAKPGTSGSGLNSLSTVASLSGVNGSALFKNATDSTAGFQVQKAGSALGILTVDTTNNLTRLLGSGINGSGAGLYFGDDDKLAIKGVGSLNNNELQIMAYSRLHVTDTSSNDSLLVDTQNGLTTISSTPGHDANGGLFVMQSNTNDVFMVSTAGSEGLVKVGYAGDLSATPFILDNDATSDPTGTKGAMYYNVSSDKFRCYQGAAWLDCLPAGGGASAFVQGGNSFAATATLGTNDSNSLALETNNVTQATIAVGGAATFKNSADSASAFQIQDSASAGLLTANTLTRTGGVAGNLLKVGNSTGTDTATTILQLDATTADPTTNLASLNGGLFYNSTTNKISLIENGTVKIICNTTDLGCGTGTVTLQNAYTNSTGGTTSEVIVDATRGALDVQDRSTSNGGTIGASLFNVRGTAATDAAAGALLFSVGNTGVVQLAGGLTADITTASAASASAITLQPGSTTTNNGTGAAATIKAGDTATGTCGTACNGGSISIQGGSATNGSGTRNGGSVSIEAGTGATGNGAINIGTNNSSNIIIGRTTGGSSSTLQAGTGGVSIGVGGVANTIQIGNLTGAVSQSINIGSNATASSTNNVNIGSSIAGTTAITGATTITNRTSGAADTLIVSNSTSTGNIALFRDNATAVLTLANGGAATFQNQTNSASGFRILNSGSGELLGANTTSSILRLLNNNNADIATGGWVSTGTSFAAGRFEHGSVTWNGYLYVVAGDDNADVPTNTVYYAKINADGTTGTWGSTSTLPQTRTEISAVVSNGYMYVIGGRNSTQTVMDTVYYAKINADGTVGTWNSTTNLTNGRTSHTSVVANGFVYVIGGSDSGGVDSATTSYAKINADGTLGSWSSGTAFAQTHRAHASVVANGYLYAIGGVVNGVNSTEVDYIKLNTDGSMAGPWSTTNTVPVAQMDAVAAVLNGYVYYMGGTGGGNNAVAYAQLGATGATSTWTTSATTLTASRRSPAAATANGYMYITGGEAGSAIATSEFASPARVTVGGSLDLVGLSGENLAEGGSGGHLTAGDTHIAGLLNVTGSASFKDSVTVGNNLTVQAQNDGSSIFSVLNASGGELVGTDSTNSVLRLLSNNTGHVPSTSSTTTLTAREGGSTVIVNGYIYMLGGCDSTGTASAVVQYARVNSNGTTGTWSTTTALPNASCDNAAAAYNGYIYVSGGGASDAISDDVYYAKVNSDGTITSWSTSVTPMPVARTTHAMAIYNGYLYAIGGYNGAFVGTRNVDYTRLGADGSTGAWTTVSNWLPAGATDGESATVANGFLYVMGDSDKNQIVYGQIANNGGIGSSGTVDSDTLSSSRYGSRIIALNGYLYVTGGHTVSGNVATATNIISYTALNSDGSIGAWTNDTSTLSGNRLSHGIASANGYIYIVAGYDGTDEVNTTLYTSGARVKVGGALDLTGYGGESLSDGGSGGQLTAGDTAIAGTLNVTGNATLKGGLSVLNNLSVNVATDTTSAFAVINAAGVPQFSIDTTNSRVYVGNPTSDTTGALLVLDTKSGSGDPTGVDGAMYYNSNMAMMRCYYSAKWRFCNDEVGMEWGYSMKEDFIATLQSTPGDEFGVYAWTYTGTTGDASVDTIAATDAKRPGILRLTTGTASTNVAALHISQDGGNEPFLIGAGDEIEFAINITNLSTAGEEFDIRAGLCDNSAGECVDGLYFEYDRNSSVNWRIGAVSNTTNKTETSTSTAVAAAGWHKFKIVVNSTSSVDYFIDGVSVGNISVSANIPSTRATSPMFHIVKSAGSTARLFNVDYFYMHNSFTTPR